MNDDLYSYDQIMKYVATAYADGFEAAIKIVKDRIFKAPRISKSSLNTIDAILKDIIKKRSCL